MALILKGKDTVLAKNFSFNDISPHNYHKRIKYTTENIIFVIGILENPLDDSQLDLNVRNQILFKTTPYDVKPLKLPLDD